MQNSLFDSTKISDNCNFFHIYNIFNRKLNSDIKKRGYEAITQHHKVLLNMAKELEYRILKGNSADAEVFDE